MALPAAHAANCAGAQGRFEAFYNVAYTKQDSLGVKPLAGFAREAGVPDMDAYSRCLAKAQSDSDVAADLRSAQEMDIPGTPGVIVNGVLYGGGVATLTIIESALRAKGGVPEPEASASAPASGRH